MTRGDFEFMWHYRGSGINDDNNPTKLTIREATIHNLLINCGHMNRRDLPRSDWVTGHNTPHGLQMALNSMDPESYVYTQNIHGYTVRVPSVRAEKWENESTLYGLGNHQKWHTKQDNLFNY